jgi:transcriptional regulator with XRE-family HTH domain
MEDPYRALGESIRKRRRALGMTLEDLESACGLRASFIGQIERNAKRGSLGTIARIASGLAWPLHRLFRPRPGPDGARLDGRLNALLRSHAQHERELLVSTLRHLSKRLRGLNRRKC